MMMATRRSSRPPMTRTTIPAPAVLARRRAGAAQGMRLQPVAGRRSQGAPAADHARASRGGFRGRIRSRALCALHRSVRPITAIAHNPLDLRATEIHAAQLAQRSRRHLRRPLARRATHGARTRLARPAARRRLRRPRGIAARREAAPFRLVHRRLSRSPSSRSKTALTRSSKPPANVSASGSKITGGRPPPITGAARRRRTALRSAGRSSAIAGHEITPTTRNRYSPLRSKRPSILTRAAPALGLTRRRATPPPRGCRPASPMATTRLPSTSVRRSRIDIHDAGDGARSDQIASADLPAFLTDDEPAANALNGASAS